MKYLQLDVKQPPINQFNISPVMITKTSEQFPITMLISFYIAAVCKPKCRKNAVCIKGKCKCRRGYYRSKLLGICKRSKFNV